MVKFNAATDEKPAEILVYGDVGDYFDGINDTEFVQQLTNLGDVKEIDLRVNSQGGEVFQGFGIYNALVRHSAKINGFVDGIAASIASVLLMAADTIRMAENSMLMIHDPWGLCMGTADELRREADALDKLKGQIAGVYAARSGKQQQDFLDAMGAETWYTAAEAKAAGLCNEVIPNKSPDGQAMNLDPRRYRNCPAWALQRAKVKPANELERSTWRLNLAKRKLELQNAASRS